MNSLMPGWSTARIAGIFKKDVTPALVAVSFPPELEGSRVVSLQDAHAHCNGDT